MEIMFIHSVYFWLRDDLTAEEHSRFVDLARALTRIETVRHGWLGVPAATDRPIIDRSYSYALTVAFDDEAGQDVYQDHPVHDRFRDECAGYWSRIVIYDAID